MVVLSMKQPSSCNLILWSICCGVSKNYLVQIPTAFLVEMFPNGSINFQYSTALISSGVLLAFSTQCFKKEIFDQCDWMFSKRTQITALFLWYSFTQGGCHLYRVAWGEFSFLTHLPERDSLGFSRSVSRWKYAKVTTERDFCIFPLSIMTTSSWLEI